MTGGQLHGGQIVPFKEAFSFDKEERRRVGDALSGWESVFIGYWSGFQEGG